MSGDDAPPHRSDGSRSDDIAPPFHVGVVAYEMEGRRSGVGRYLEGLLRGLQTESPPGWRWTLFFRGEPFDSALFSQDPAATFRAVFDHRPGSRPIAWEQLRLPWILRRHRLDFLFSPAYSLPPFAGVPRMLTLHDLSFERLPEEFGWRERLRRRVLARLAAARATRVLTDTGRVALEISVQYGVPQDRLGVIPLAVDEQFFVSTPDQPLPDGLAALGVEPPYVLHLGSILPRRHIDLTLEAFAMVAGDRPNLQLVLAGADRLPDRLWLEPYLNRSPVADRIVRIPWVPEGLLVPLYAHAAVSVYVSSYEGYGLPPLESLAAGTPAVVNTGMALDEIWPDYPFLVERCVQEVADAMERALDGPGPGFREYAHRVLGRLDWQASARRLVEEIRIARGTAP